MGNVHQEKFLGQGAEEIPPCDSVNENRGNKGLFYTQNKTTTLGITKRGETVEELEKEKGIDSKFGNLWRRGVESYFKVRQAALGTVNRHSSHRTSLWFPGALNPVRNLVWQ